MLWVTWRQQRLEAAIGGAMLAIVALFLLITGLALTATYRGTGLAACVARQTQSQACQSAAQAFIGGQFNALAPILTWFNFLPLVFGLLLAAPVVLELEQGTYRLAWTQSVTRLRWVMVKLGLIVAGAVVIGFALTTLLTWWLGPANALQGRFYPGGFGYQGLAPIAYTVFAVALGVAVGTLLRRTIPAVGITLIGFVALRLGIEAWVRPHYLPPLMTTGTANVAPPSRLDWLVSSNAIWRDRLGRELDFNGVERLCGAPSAAALACLRQRGVREVVLYQPADRFWLFQGIESAIFLGLAAGLLALTVWWVRYRIA